MSISSRRRSMLLAVVLGLAGLLTVSPSATAVTTDACADGVTVVVDFTDVGGEVEVGCAVATVAREDAGFAVQTARGCMRAPALVVATGGLSIPSMGASGFGYQLARQFGHAVLPTRAGLVPLTLSGKHQQRLEDLSGVALEVEASCNGARFRGAMLVTHRGISGPAILQVSSYWAPGDDLRPQDAPGFVLDHEGPFRTAGRVRRGHRLLHVSIGYLRACSIVTDR